MMTDTAIPPLTSKQRRRLARIRRAFRSQIEAAAGHTLEDMEAVDRDGLDRFTIEKFKTLNYDEAYLDTPHPSSGFRTGRQLRREIQRLQNEGIL